MNATCKLIRVDISRNFNDDGKLAWLVTPVYRRIVNHVEVTVSIPDGRGWPTRGEAEAEAVKIATRG